jgi:hypothetical protein
MLTAAAFATGLLIWYVNVPAVSAKELVDRAVRDEMQHPRHAARFYVRDADGSCALSATNSQAVAAQPSCSRMRSRLESAHWDMEYPLSARAFERWRGSLADKKDTVTEQRDTVRLRTTTTLGALRAATLEVRRTDFHAIAARLEFDGAAQIEIGEDFTPEPVVSASVSPMAPTAAPVLPTVRPSEPTPAESLDTAEVQARIALHHVRADLGYEIVVRRETDSLEVFGLVRDEARQSELTAALAGIPGLRVHIKTYAQFEAGDDSRFPRGEQGNTLPPLAAKWLKSSYPSFEDSARFVNRTIGTATALLGEAAVLQELTSRMAELSGSGSLAVVQRDHQERVASLLASLANDLQPLTGPLAGVRAIGTDQARVLLSAVTRCLSASRDEAASLEDEIARIRAIYNGINPSL